MKLAGLIIGYQASSVCWGKSSLLVADLPVASVSTRFVTRIPLVNEWVSLLVC